jgi:hypothetical protein
MAKANPSLHQDPTRDEMLAFLIETFPTEWALFDAEEAIYWFANDYHSGQWSELYKALCASEYHPGPLANGPASEEMYSALVSKWGQG